MTIGVLFSVSVSDSSGALNSAITKEFSSFSRMITDKQTERHRIPKNAIR